ncbi:MAG: response regulator transcription factor [Anaerolineales bacterium]|nr:response regulator transcription factor [Anaerolineales bacterium]
MTAMATHIVERFFRTPAEYFQLNEIHQEFCHWLIHKHLSQRDLVRLLWRISQTTGKKLVIPKEGDIVDLYPTDTRESDIWRQLSEMVDLVSSLKLDKIIVYADISPEEAEVHRQDLFDLIDLMELADFPNFVLRLAAPQQIVQSKSSLRQATSQHELIRLDYTQETINQILCRYVQAATDSRLTDLAAVATAEVWQAIQEMIADSYAPTSIGAWLHALETVMIVGQDSALPVNDANKIQCEFYRRFVPLRLAPNRQGIIRGETYLALDRQLFDLMSLLLDLNGASAEGMLMDLTGGGPNLNTAMSRLRRIVEPVPGTNLYIQNKRDRGYFLENPSLI